MGRNFGTAVSSVIRDYGFEALLLGGSISKSADLFIDDVKNALAEAEVSVDLRAIRNIDMAPLYGAVFFFLKGIRPTL